MLCKRKGAKIVEAEVCPDHIHMLVEIPPSISVSGFVGYLKGKSTLMIFERHANLKYKYGNRHFWCRGYYVDTVGKNANLLEESVTDDMEHLETSKDEDAKTGHKTADTSFFGYKTHIAMTEERIITAATITSGEKTDGKELPKLVQKSKAAGIQIESVIGDMAYSEKKNIEAAKEGDYELIAKLNPIITQGNRRKEDEFEFNKDAGMYQCKAGHLAIHKYFDKRKKDKKTKTHVWSIFSILKNVNVVLIVVAVIKKEPKRKHTQKQSFAIPTVNRLNFRKLSISKKKCGNAIK